MDIAPDTALVRRIDRSSGLPMAREIRMPVDEVAVNEAVIVGPGERLPLDGVVVSGASSVDQSPITGESVPVDVEPGSQVFAGAINGPGALVIKVTKVAGDFTLSNIIAMVEEAQARRAPTQQLVDRFSAIYTPLVIAGAILIAVVPPLLFGQPFDEWFYRALVLLVVACPCALVISTPVSIVAAIGAATRRGVLIKGGSTLEELGRVRVVAFDKTGTLTIGQPHVVSVDALDGDQTRRLTSLRLPNCALTSDLARAVVHASREFRATALPCPRRATSWLLPAWAHGRWWTGRRFTWAARASSVRAAFPSTASVPGWTRSTPKGRPQCLSARLPEVLGVIALADTPRAEARSSLDSLRRAGIKELDHAHRRQPAYRCLHRVERGSRRLQGRSPAGRESGSRAPSAR